jgi:hypothetical protein
VAADSISIFDSGFEKRRLSMRKYASRIALAVLVLGLLFWPTAAQTVHQIVLTWTASTTTGVNYNVYRGTLTGGPYTKLTVSPTAALTYADTSGTGGTKYFYVVTAICTASCPTGITGESGFSAEASATFLAAPGAPTGLQAVAQ